MNSEPHEDCNKWWLPEGIKLPSKADYFSALHAKDGFMSIPPNENPDILGKHCSAAGTEKRVEPGEIIQKDGKPYKVLRIDEKGEAVLVECGGW